MSATYTRAVTGFAFAVASGLLVAATNPASAANPDPATLIPADGAAMASDTNATTRQDRVKYCIIDLSIGNRIPQRMCKTKAQWAQQGVRVNVQ